MKTKYFLTLFSILFLTFGFQSSPNKVRQLKVVSFSQSGYELGLQHGKLFEKEIDEIITKWHANIKRFLGDRTDKFISDFLEYSKFDVAIKKHTPDLYEEMKGIAKGSNQEFDDIYLLNLLDEFWVFLDNLRNHHCSDVGVPSINGSTSYVAQNMDLENYPEGYQTLVKLAGNENRPSQMILTFPGLVALNGMNDTGIGVCVNTLMQLKASSEGLPVAFVVRRIINSTDKSDLLDFIQNVNHASGQNYIIGIRGEIYDFEASANKVVRFSPKNLNGTVYHTNHPIVNKDIKEWHLKRMAATSPDNSKLRLEAVKKRMVSEKIIRDDIIKEALRSKDNAENPVCNAYSEDGYGFTFASTIMTLTGKLSMQVTPGPPDESDYQEFFFNKK
jgi:hypothetical protein